MSENTSIEWADHTFNPWEGCTKVGPGCDHCYAEARNIRFGGGAATNWGPGAPRRRTSAANWAKPILWNRRAATAQRGWEAGLELAKGDEGQLLEGGYFKPQRPRVFCASLADVFDNEVSSAWRADLFELIAATPYLDWLLLTKRIGNATTMMADALSSLPAANRDGFVWPLPNVWIGATVVDQTEADRDIPKLLATPATVRFLSIEPMLGFVDLTRVAPARGWASNVLTGTRDDFGVPHADLPAKIDWVIAGGESGLKARPSHPDWYRKLRMHCARHGTPFLFKQWGEWGPYGRGRIDGAALASQQSLDEPLQRFGKKLAGRILDGVEHNGFPEARR